MKAPLILENQKDGNFDDSGHYDDFKSFWNPYKKTGPMHAQVTAPDAAKKEAKGEEAKPVEAAKKDAKKAAEAPKKLGEAK